MLVSISLAPTHALRPQPNASLPNSKCLLITSAQFSLSLSAPLFLFLPLSFSVSGLSPRGSLRNSSA